MSFTFAAKKEKITKRENIFSKTLMPYLIAVSGLAILTAIMFALRNFVSPITVALVLLLFILVTIYLKQLVVTTYAIIKQS